MRLGHRTSAGEPAGPTRGPELGRMDPTAEEKLLQERPRGSTTTPSQGEPAGSNTRATSAGEPAGSRARHELDGGGYSPAGEFDDLSHRTSAGEPAGSRARVCGAWALPPGRWLGGTDGSGGAHSADPRFAESGGASSSRVPRWCPQFWHEAAWQASNPSRTASWRRWRGWPSAPAGTSATCTCTSTTSALCRASARAPHHAQEAAALVAEALGGHQGPRRQGHGGEGAIASRSRRHRLRHDLDRCLRAQQLGRHPCGRGSGGEPAPLTHALAREVAPRRGLDGAAPHCQRQPNQSPGVGTAPSPAGRPLSAEGKAQAANSGAAVTPTLADRARRPARA